MTKIMYQTDQKNGALSWIAAESFEELRGKSFRLDEMEAAQIEKMPDLSVTAKILLSAAVGATIQHLIDKGMDTETIFRTGFFEIA